MRRSIISIGLLLFVSTAASAFGIHRAVFDFDGDGKSDELVVRTGAVGLTWYALRSNLGPYGAQWGSFSVGDQLLPGDYDGDGKWDIAVFRTGNILVFQSSNGAFVQLPAGTGDVIDRTMTQDYDGDGKFDPAVTQDVNGNLAFDIRRSSLGLIRVLFGNPATDVALRGDFDGDGKADVGVYRKANGSPANTFIVLPSGGGPVRYQQFGNSVSDYAIPADFDGDGKTDYAVVRARGAVGDITWYWIRSSDGVFAGQSFGGTTFGDLPTPGDYDGDGKTDLSVWRAGSQSYFYHLGQVSGFEAVPFGISGDIPPANLLQVK